MKRKGIFIISIIVLAFVFMLISGKNEKYIVYVEDEKYGYDNYDEYELKVQELIAGNKEFRTEINNGIKFNLKDTSKEYKLSEKQIDKLMEQYVYGNECPHEQFLPSIWVASCEVFGTEIDTDTNIGYAGYYFAELNKIAQGESTVLKADQVPTVSIPIRRFFARLLDYSIYTIAWNAFVMIGCGKDLSSAGLIGSLANTLVIFIIMIVCESILLSQFGTTLGKCILGIRVRDIDDGKLSFLEACERCVYLIFYGYGLGIPFYQMYREWKSYKTCKSGEPLKWEEKSCVILKDGKVWRNLVFALVLLLVSLVEVFIPYFAELPNNRGEITVSEFSENYNQLLEYKKALGGGMLLDENGKWKERGPEDQVMFGIPIEDYPDITYYVEDGVMTGMNFKGEISNIYENELKLLIKAFVYAEEPESVILSEVESVCDEITQSYANIEEKQYQIGNVEIYYKDNLGEFELEMKIREGK